MPCPVSGIIRLKKSEWEAYGVKYLLQPLGTKLIFADKVRGDFLYAGCVNRDDNQINIHAILSFGIS